MRRKSWDDDEEQKRTPCLALFSVSLVTFICLNIIGSVSNKIFTKNFRNWNRNSSTWDIFLANWVFKTMNYFLITRNIFLPVDSSDFPHHGGWCGCYRRSKIRVDFRKKIYMIPYHFIFLSLGFSSDVGFRGVKQTKQFWRVIMVLNRFLGAKYYFMPICSKCCLFLCDTFKHFHIDWNSQEKLFNYCGLPIYPGNNSYILRYNYVILSIT